MWEIKLNGLGYLELRLMEAVVSLRGLEVCEALQIGVSRCGWCRKIGCAELQG